MTIQAHDTATRMMIQTFKRAAPSALAQWRKTPEGARAWCYAMQYRPALCFDELKILAAVEDAESERIWSSTLFKVQTLFPDYSEQEQIMTAELMMVEKLRIPPHWKYTIDCEHCGFVPAGAPAEGVVSICPWCSTMDRS